MTDESSQHDQLRALLVLGSVREGRLVERIDRLLGRHLRHAGLLTSTLDPRALNFPLLNKMYKEHPRSSAPRSLAEVAESIGRADAVMILSAEYNHGVPPALSNLMDHFLEEWFHKPAAVVTYSSGRFGGVRVLMPLRSMIGEMGMISTSSSLALPGAGDLVLEDGKAVEAWVDRGAASIVAELAWWARAARGEHERSGPPFGH